MRCELLWWKFQKNVFSFCWSKVKTTFAGPSMYIYKFNVHKQSIKTGLLQKLSIKYDFETLSLVTFQTFSCMYLIETPRIFIWVSIILFNLLESVLLHIYQTYTMDYCLEMNEYTLQNRYVLYPYDLFSINGPIPNSLHVSAWSHKSSFEKKLPVCVYP